MSARQPARPGPRPPPPPATEPVHLRLATGAAQPGSQVDAHRPAGADGLADAVLEQVADAVVVMDPDGRIGRVNAAFSRLTGIPAATAAGLGISELLGGPEDERLLSAGWACLDRADHWRGRGRLRRHDAECIPLRANP